MQVNIFNRKQLLADFDLTTVAQAREILNLNGIPLHFCKKRGDDSVAHATGKGGSASVMRTYVYLLYVKRSDFERAKGLLSDAKLL